MIDSAASISLLLATGGSASSGTAWLSLSFCSSSCSTSSARCSLRSRSMSWNRLKDIARFRWSTIGYSGSATVLRAL
uniref:Putative secreted protein n=1 Tax=Anopheles darlingi TaxID=43151 RepID=A0A2M4DKC6_ANODA